jgi:GC-rich sequence DNA-binding factor
MPPPHGGTAIAELEGMFVKRKTSRPTRERLLDDDKEKSVEPQESPSTLASKLKKKNKPKVKSRLSFGGDEDEVT